ncbi:MAG: GWxTD domain-containing protein, partial [Longimicrobiales bacterium]
LHDGRADDASRLALSRVAASLGEMELAASAVESLSHGTTGESALARHALAVAWLRTPGREEHGARAYFDAVDRMTPAVASLLFEDLRLIARESERERWQALDHAARRAWLHDFWDLRAALSGVAVHERIAEHYRRLAAASDRYPRRIRWGAPPRNALLLQRLDAPFDDRGVILVRHGEPLEVIRTLDPNLVQNESWVYAGLDGRDRMFHFANYGSVIRSGRAGDGDGYAEWLLVYNVLCGGTYAADREGRDPRFSSLARRCDEAERRTRSAEIRRDAYEALRTNTDPPDFTRDLPFTYSFYSFRAPGGRTELAAAIDRPRTPEDTVLVALDASFILVDTADAVVVRRDTTLHAKTTAASHDAAGVVSLQVLPTTAAVHRIVLRDASDAGHGRFAGGPIVLPDYTGTDLMLSDIVLAAPDTGGPWRRGDHHLRPSDEFESGDLHVYYEVYNVAAGERHRTELIVERTSGGIRRALGRLFGRAAPIRLSFEEQATTSADGTLHELRRLRAPLYPGEYRLRIRVSTPARNQTARKETLFTVR